jgi:hypothetical protein
MNVRAQVSLDKFGCLCVVVLAVAIHWVLAARFGAHGFLGGFFAWAFAFGAGLWIAGAAQARGRRLARGAFANSACPRCGLKIGGDAADAIVLDAERRAGEAFSRAAQERTRLRHVVRWSGECRGCHGHFVFDPEAMTLTPFEIGK